MTDVGFIDLGPCQVVWDPDTEDVTFQPHGSVMFRDSVDHQLLTKGSSGSTPYGGKFTGRQVEAVVPITDALLADIENIIPSATFTDGDSNMVVGNCVGEDMTDYAAEVVIQPIGKEAGATGEDTNYWLYLLNAVPVLEMELDYGTEDQQVVAVRFIALPDGSGNLWRMGPAAA